MAVLRAVAIDAQGAKIGCAVVGFIPVDVMSMEKLSGFIISQINSAFLALLTYDIMICSRGFFSIWRVRMGEVKSACGGFGMVFSPCILKIPQKKIHSGVSGNFYIPTFR